jgi:putative flippase GtrA
LQGTSRTAVRFLVVGNSGALIQYLLYLAFLFYFKWLDKDSEGWVSAAFTIAYVLEMVYNYLMQAYYVFECPPQWKNLSGFLVARLINYLLQMFLLWLFTRMINEEAAGIVAIVLAGIVNYFVMRLFFKQKK